MQEFNTIETLALLCFGLWAVLVPFYGFKRIKLPVDVIATAFFWLLILNQAVAWWRGYWTIGPYWTPVAIIGPEGRHTDGSVAALRSAGRPGLFLVRVSS